MRKSKIECGHYFLVPNSSGGFYLGQLAADFPEIASVFCYFFDELGLSQCPEKNPIDNFSRRIVAAALVTHELIRNGTWKVCALKHDVPQHVMLLKTRELQKGDFVGATINGAGLVSQFLDTHFGRLPLSHWATPDLVQRFFEVANLQAKD